MKQVKLNLMAIIGLMVAVGTMAFTAPKQKVTFNANAVTWYYQSNSMADVDVNNAANYSTTNGTGSACEGEVVICSILDEEDSLEPGQPALSHGKVSLRPQAYLITERDEF